MVLRYDLFAPEGVAEGAPVIVLLHGRGGDKSDLLPLGRLLWPGALTVTAEAPFPGAPWGYGPGWAWYRFLERNRPEPESFAAAQAKLGEFLRDLPNRLPVAPGPLVLGGFSQGGTMSMAYALLHPGDVTAALNFSGFLADHPSLRPLPAPAPATPIFWGHGRSDRNVAFALAEAGWAELRAAGANLTAQAYAFAHTIDQAELRAASAWLQSLL